MIQNPVRAKIEELKKSRARSNLPNLRRLSGQAIPTILSADCLWRRLSPAKTPSDRSRGPAGSDISARTVLPVWEHSLNVQKFLLESDVAVEDSVEGAVVDSATDEKHPVGVGFQPPGA